MFLIDSYDQRHSAAALRVVHLRLVYLAYLPLTRGLFLPQKSECTKPFGGLGSALPQTP